MFKFALFLAVALVAVQGFQARSVETDFAQSRGLIDVINGFIQRIKDLVSGIGNIVGDLVQGLSNKIKEIINQIPEVINQIKKKIEDLIVEAGEVGRKCVDEHEKDIEAIVDTARNGMTACANEAQAKVNEIQEQVNALVAKVNEAQQDVSNRVAKCVADANLNPIKLYNCLRGLVDPIQEDIAEIEKEVGNTISVAKDTIAEATVGLAKCSAAVQEDVANKQEALFNALKECISGSIN